MKWWIKEIYQTVRAYSYTHLRKFEFPKSIPLPRTSCAILLLLITTAVFFPADTYGFSVNAGAGQSSLQGFGQFASVIINIFTFLALLILSLVGDLMGTEFITGPEAQEALLPIWRYVRNMVNISAVLMIVYLSFSNLVSNISGDGGGGTWSWQIKDKLPRIIFMLVAVNFSMLGFRLVIDAIHIGSITILSIADTQLESNSAESIDRILTGNKWRRVMKNSNEVKEEQMPNPTTEGETIDKYAEWNREEKANGFIDKIEGKTCEDALQDDILSEDDIKNGKKLWSHARYFNEKSKTYEHDVDSVLVCGSFNEQINSTFCADGLGNDDCFFRIKSDFSFRNQQVKPGNKTSQNLFMAFGVIFMRIEQLPSLAANIDNIFQVIDNTLFSTLMAIMYVIVLASLFFVLIARILVLWLAIAFSPVVIGLSIMGINTPGGGMTEKVITHMLVPLKISAAFAISFVMMSSMIDFKPAGRLGMFEFGPSLSAIAVDEYAIMWQIATVVIFWGAAKWALEGTYADTIVKGIMDSAKTVGEYALKAATVENQVFSLKDGKGVKREISLQGLLDAPKRIASLRLGALENADSEYYRTFVKDTSFKNEAKRYETLAALNKEEYAQQTKDYVKRVGIETISANRKEFIKTIKNKKNQSSQTEGLIIDPIIKEFETNQFTDGVSNQDMADFLNKIVGKNIYTAKDFKNTYDKTKDEKGTATATYNSEATADNKINIGLSGKTHDDKNLSTTNINLNVDEIYNVDQNDNTKQEKAEESKDKVLKIVTDITGEDTNNNTSTNYKTATNFFEVLQQKTPQEVWNNVILPQSAKLNPAIKNMFKYILFDVAQKDFDDKDRDGTLTDTEKERYDAFVKTLNADEKVDEYDYKKDAAEPIDEGDQ